MISAEFVEKNMKACLAYFFNESPRRGALEPGIPGGSLTRWSTFSNSNELHNRDEYERIHYKQDALRYANDVRRISEECARRLGYESIGDFLLFEDCKKNYNRI